MTPSAPIERLRQIALLVLDDGQLPGTVDERRIDRQSIGQTLADAVAGPPPPLLEDVVDEPLATDRADGRQQPVGETVVVGREQVLGGIRDVVDVARPADAVADGPPAHEAGRLQRVELLQHARAARAEPGREVLGRATGHRGAAAAAGCAAGRTSRPRPSTRGDRAALVPSARWQRGGGRAGALRGSGIVREG